MHALFVKNGFKKLKIISYHVKLTEKYLNSHKVKGFFIKLIEGMINFWESIFPMLSGGYVVKIEL